MARSRGIFLGERRESKFRRFLSDNNKRTDLVKFLHNRQIRRRFIGRGLDELSPNSFLYIALIIQVNGHII